jgi:hypothetical protein
MITGQVFGPNANIQRYGESCAFSKGNTVISTDSYAVAGYGNYQRGGNYSRFINSFHTSAYNGIETAAFNAISSTICTNQCNVQQGGTLIGGHSNYIDSVYTLLVSGSANTALSSCGANIYSGRFNTIRCSPLDSRITGGEYNCIDTSVYGTIGTGLNNTLSATCCSRIITGQNNLIRTRNCADCGCMRWARITTGQYNRIDKETTTTTNYSTGAIIDTGQYNCIDQVENSTGGLNRIFNGYGNISCCGRSTNPGQIYNGKYNRTDTPGDYTIFNGVSNCAVGTCYCNSRAFILNGINNCLSGTSAHLGARGQAIFNGENNTTNAVGSARCKLIYSGRGNIVGEDNIIYGGLNNYATSECDYNRIWGGRNNAVGMPGVEGVGCRVCIYGGSDHRTCLAIYATIVGGISACAEGSCTTFPAVNYAGNIVGGCENKIWSKCDERAVIGGYKNQVCINSTSPGGGIAGGCRNYVSNLCGFTFGSNLSTQRNAETMVNNLIITDLPVGDGTGWCAYTWYRCPGEDIIRVV